MRLYKLMPIIDTDDIPQGVGAYVLTTIVLYWCKMRPKYKHDKGLHEHEWTHVKQHFRMLLIFHPLLYKFNRAYRLKCEVEAYAEQLKYSLHWQRDLDAFARFIATRYNLDVKQSEAKQLLLRAVT